MLKKVKWLFFVCAMMTVILFTGCTEDGYVADKASVMGIDIGKLSREEAVGVLSEVVLDASDEVVIIADGERIVLSSGEIGASYNAEKTVDYVIEKSRGVFSGWFEKNYYMTVDVDESMLSEALARFETEGSAKTALVVDDGIMVTNAVSSKKLDRGELLEKISECMGSEDKEDIEVSYIINATEGPSDTEILSALQNEFKEPEYIMNEDGVIYVTEAAAGVNFDMAEAEKIMNEHTEEGETFIIPCEVKKPLHTKEELENALFRDTLGTYTTSYATSSANRSSNIALAASKINGMILMPGDEFSFNNTLGERTVENGYKMAGAYVGGKTVDQVGGGICQVSSTLYNAALLSNLGITSRRSHQMTVSYVPVGRDATVNWGTTDFRFKNNTEYPVKLVGKTEGKKVTLTVVGTMVIPQMTVKIETNTVSVIEPGELYEEDPEMPVGEFKTEKGSNGYVVDAVRVVYSNGAEVSRESLTRSRYNPKNTVITVGTKVVETPTDAPVAEEEMPAWLKPFDASASGTGL